MDLGTSPADLNRGWGLGPFFNIHRAGHSKCGIVSVFGVYHLSLFLGVKNLQLSMCRMSISS
jgi:hypothetical protein